MKSDYFTRIAVAAFSLLPALSLLLPFEGQAAQTNLVAPPAARQQDQSDRPVPVQRREHVPQEIRRPGERHRHKSEDHGRPI